MIAGGAAALINFLITSPPSFISLVREREEEIQTEAFHAPDFIRSFPAKGPGCGAPWGSCASLHSSQEENSAAIPCPGLVGAQGTHRIGAGEGTNPQIPWNPLCFPALLEAWVTVSPCWHLTLPA